MELRSFLIAAASTFSLLEVTNSEAYLPTGSDLQSLVLKALITLLVGTISSVVTRVIRKKHQSGKKSQPKSKKAVASSQTTKKR